MAWTTLVPRALCALCALCALLRSVAAASEQVLHSCLEAVHHLVYAQR
ncbi:hypothetical protein BFJ68_g1309 [Fusarium oxysporum]|uniref:Uncharacterized protein n=1 Tax=Fusarium oxysporum TaxID=5507 RepID=A0A420S1I4_FUSOX|nr:hypothetical protein BFJ68_g1309 [Fusarium oxysporum]